MKRYLQLLSRGGLVVLSAGVLFALFALDLQKTPTGYMGIIEVPEVKLHETGNNMILCRMPGYVSIRNSVGQAGIPQKTVRLAIGQKCLKPIVKVHILKKEEIKLVNKIYPVQMEWTLNRPVSERPFSFDFAYYTTEGKATPLVSISEPFGCHGIPGVELTIRPVYYNPVKNLLVVIKKYKLDITMPEGIGSIPILSSKAHYAYVKKVFLNSNDISFSNAGTKENYLIIVAPTYDENEDLARFITFREKLYNVSKVTTTESGGSASAIKSYLQDLWNGSPEEKPCYVLFVGKGANSGNDAIPYHSGSASTYWSYHKMDTDNYGDIFVGCFFVRSATKLKNIINKTIYTEENIDDYPKVTTQYSSYSDNAHIKNECNTIKTWHWDKSDLEVSWMVPEVNQSGSTFKQPLIKQINANETRYVAYQGHGSQTSWQSGLSTSDVNNLTNDEVFPFVWSFACLTGTFTNSSECLGEAWIGAEGGGCMFTGASVSSSYYQKIFNAGMACGAAKMDDLTTIGQIYNFAKMYCRDSTAILDDPGFNKVGSILYESGEAMYNLFGDPALETITYETGISMVDKTVSACSMRMKSFTSSLITLDIPSAGKYTLEAYAADGQKIRTIAADKYLSAGEQVLPWNGSVFANGLYFIHLSKEKKTVVNKIILLQ